MGKESEGGRVAVVEFNLIYCKPNLNLVFCLFVSCSRASVLEPLYESLFLI